MKRTKEETTSEDGGRKKRVRFDPQIKDNEPEPSGNPVVKTPKRPLDRDADGFDILGRKIGQPVAGTNNVDEEENSIEQKDKKHTLDSDEEDDKHEPKRLDIKSVSF